MFVFWWTGKGFQTVLITLVALAVSAILFQAIAPKLNDQPWPWMAALIGAAVANWKFGRQYNAKSRTKIRSTKLKDQLIYRARHKFMSLPMETFSLVMLAGVAAGLALAINGLR